MVLDDCKAFKQLNELFEADERAQKMFYRVWRRAANDDAET